MKKRGKKAEGFLGMGFGMIFSIFLIIIFIITAVYAIKQFLSWGDCTKVGTFLNDFQNEVSTIFNSQHSSVSFPGTLPYGVKYVCFTNFSDKVRGQFLDIGQDLSFYGGTRDNLFFYPRGKACIKAKQILNLNMASITKIDNPYCIPVVKGKITIGISKGFNQGLVNLA